MKDLKGLSLSIIDALGNLPADASADTRVSVVEQLVHDHVRGAVKAITNVDAYGAFLRDSGFAKAAVKKLAPAFKALTGDLPHDAISEQKLAAVTGVLAAIREVNDTLQQK